MSPFVAIKKIDGSELTLNLEQVVSVELIPNKGDSYYMVTDTNGKVHLVDQSPFVTKVGMVYVIKEAY